VREALDTLAARIRGAQRLTILTGAGVSAASGVPTFRGPEGLWRRYRPEDLATPDAFARDPHLVWEWYAWRREKIAACEPNPAHAVIATWSSGIATPSPDFHRGQTPLHLVTGVRPRYDSSPGSDPRTRRLKVVVVTQNVDDLHVRAGTKGLVRLHGSIWQLSCWDRCANGSTAWRDERVPLPDLPPRCPHCGGLARPGVVWFGESLGTEDVNAALLATDCDVFLTVGTSAVVHPAAGLVEEARRRGAFTAEINMEATPASLRVDLALHGAAERILPELNAAVAAPRR
jgi:NAD-dependent deacetylase